LKTISKLAQTYLEKIEVLEQLRILEKGYKIKVIETKCDSISGISVDTPEYLIKVEEIMKKMGEIPWLFNNSQLVLDCMHVVR